MRAALELSTERTISLAQDHSLAVSARIKSTLQLNMSNKYNLND